MHTVADVVSESRSDVRFKCVTNVGLRGKIMYLNSKNPPGFCGIFLFSYQL